jgi:tight adherence protein B
MSVFGLDTVVVAIIGLAALSASAALGFTACSIHLDRERAQGGSRVKRVKAAETDRVARRPLRGSAERSQQEARSQVQDSLKTLEEKNKENDRRREVAAAQDR